MLGTSEAVVQSAPEGNRRATGHLHPSRWPDDRHVPSSGTIVYLHLTATLVMTGVIWFVQVVHYPLMANVAADRFALYEQLHTQRTAWVVMPPMLLELGTAIALVAIRPPTLPVDLTWLGLGLLATIWLSTFLLQVPQHTILQQGFDPRAHRFLVSSNWLRTGLWSIRAALALAFVAWMR